MHMIRLNTNRDYVYGVDSSYWYPGEWSNSDPRTSSEMEGTVIGWTKLNSDGVVDVVGGRIETGVVAQDQMGMFVSARFWKKPGLSIPIWLNFYQSGM